MKKILLTCLALLAALALQAQDAGQPDYRPRVSGCIRAKYEFQPQEGAGRFEVRNCRLALSGKVLPMVSYKAEIDLSDEGKIKMKNAYVRATPSERWQLTVGYMRVPFSIDAPRSPHRQYFANRSFIAKQVGNVRDAGAAIGYTLPLPRMRLTLEGGVFNGSGLTDQKDFWTKKYNYALKLTAQLDNRLHLVLGGQRICPERTGITLWNAGAYLHTGRWHVEGEYISKHYSHGAFPRVNAIDAFACHTLPLRKTLAGISFLARYDYMDRHSNGIADANGILTANDPKRHRATAGLTLHLARKAVSADIRLNYEKYFYDREAVPRLSEQDKAVVELVCYF